MTRLLLVLLVSSCTLTVDSDPACTGGKCDGGNADQTCTDPHYGDGTCQMQLDCAVPDIDCFETFDTDAAAAAWYAKVEPGVAAADGKMPRTIIAESDPRFQHARDLLDRGWDAFRAHRPVGKLADKRPALVVLDDSTINAFVVPDAEKQLSAFSVQVLTGALATNADDDALLGLMMHELQHAVGLHLINDGRDRIRRYYIAQGTEPIGASAPEDARAKTAGVAWRQLADDVGGYDDELLAGMPIAGDLDDIFITVVNAGLMKDATACQPSVGAANDLRSYIRQADPIDVHLTPDLSDVPTRAQQVLAALRDDCLATFPYGFVDIVAQLKHVTVDEARAQLDPHDLALVDGQHVIDAIAALEADRRAKMRAAETSFADQTGQAWSALRYYSYEENADDTSVAVLRAAGLDPAGMSKFLESALPGDGEARCDQLLAAGTVPPYGVDLSDEHHATCWRVAHIRALAKQGSAPRELPPHPVTTTRARLVPAGPQPAY